MYIYIYISFNTVIIINISTHLFIISNWPLIPFINKFSILIPLSVFLFQTNV